MDDQQLHQTREPGWYWVWNEKAKKFEVLLWSRDSQQWYRSGIQGGFEPDTFKPISEQKLRPE